MQKNHITNPLRIPKRDPIIREKTEIRTLFEDIMLKLALQFKEETKNAKKEQEETKYCIGAVIFSWSFLEAYINNFINNKLYRFKTDMDGNDYLQLPTIQKYRFISKIISGKTFSKEKEPFNSFLLLKRIRNKLVHYEAKMEEIGEYVKPKKIEKQCQEKFKIKEKKSMDVLRKILTRECAEWVIKTTIDVVKEFEDNVYGKNNHTFLIKNILAEELNLKNSKL